MNLNVYAYCMNCGRGFDGPGEREKTSGGRGRRFWPFGRKAS